MDRPRRAPGAVEALSAAAGSAAGLVALNVIVWPLLRTASASGWPSSAALAISATASEVGLGLPLVALILASGLDVRLALGLRAPRLPALLFSLIATLGAGAVLDELMHLAVRAAPGLRSEGLYEVGRSIASASTAEAILLLVPLALVPAICEEALCRGVVLRGLGRALPAWGAVVLSSVYFGLLHLDRLHGPAAFLMGLVLATIAQRTASLWPAVACHLANNCVSVLVPALGGPSLPDVLDHGSPSWMVALGAAALVVGTVGLVLTTRSGARKAPAG